MEDRFKLRCYNKFQEKMFDVKNISYINGIVKRIEVQDDERILIFDEWQNNIDNTVLMQCTGLKDKNSKLIYEGDIINIWCRNFTKNQISEVKFCKERAAFTFDYITDFHNIVPCTMEKTEIEVIGNIYENKDLIEVEE